MLAIFPELVNLAQSENVEYLSVRIRQYFGGNVSTNPMLDLDLVIDGLGIPSQTIELGYPAALAADDKGGSFTVGLFFDVTVTGVQRRFLQAHMLAHFLFDYQNLIATGELKKTGYKEAVLPLKRYTSGLGANLSNPIESRREELCDKFAAALLMPKGMLLKVYSALEDTDKVARIFGVTSDAVLQRLSDLGAMVSGAQINMDAERRLRGHGEADNGFTQKVSSDDVSRLNAPNTVSVIKENQAREFARSVAEENMLAMKSMNGGAAEEAPSPGNMNRHTLSSGSSNVGRVAKDVENNAAGSDGQGESTLRKLRMLASRIDSSVKID